MKDSKVKTPPKKVGRKKIKIDYQWVDKLARCGHTQEDIGDLLEISVRTLQRDAEFCHIYKKGVANAKSSLRFTLFRHAETHYQCAIFLAKNLLGMMDQPNIQVGGNVNEHCEKIADTLAQLDNNTKKVQE